MVGLLLILLYALRAVFWFSELNQHWLRIVSMRSRVVFENDMEMYVDDFTWCGYNQWRGNTNKVQVASFHLWGEVDGEITSKCRKRGLKNALECYSIYECLWNVNEIVYNNCRDRSLIIAIVYVILADSNKVCGYNHEGGEDDTYILNEDIEMDMRVPRKHNIKMNTR